ncbi:ankyrin repeat domain-containing protein [Burkholderia pyrrocinia]|uniref:ankyrin repeat domain-containing protein n=1 Tax=Burkholderia pyrrocinia TaxID=60550 RepID=UPI002ABE1702|nr:ankyrin repeat domain-containing protein [Burkholderia pyrrocinia]
MRTLIDSGVKVDHVNRLGWTALLEAIMLGDGSERYVRIVQFLVDGHANVNLARCGIGWEASAGNRSRTMLRLPVVYRPSRLVDI